MTGSSSAHSRVCAANRRRHHLLTPPARTPLVEPSGPDDSPTARGGLDTCQPIDAGWNPWTCQCSPRSSRCWPRPRQRCPTTPGVWSYEPKWDGFRALVFRDGDDVVMQSRNGKELGRYFPELLDALRDELAPRCVLDGEVVVPREIDGRIRLDWESLSQRIHPAEQPGQDAGRADARRTSSASTRSPPATRRCWASRSAPRRRGAGRLVNEKQWCHVTRTTEDPELGAQWLDHVRGRRPGRGDRQAARRASTCRASARWSRSSTPATPTAWRSATGSTRAARASGRSCSACTATTANCRWSAAQRRSRVKDRLKLLAELEPLREGDEVDDGEPQPMELRGRQAVDPGAAGEGVRGGLRPDGGQHRRTASGSATP